VVIKADHAAFFSASIGPNQCASRFQLALFWSTNHNMLIPNDLQADLNRLSNQ